MHIISASRRTDIPQFYGKWFAARRRAGFARYRTVFGGGKNGYFEASLKPEDVLGYLFWTKCAAPFHEELASLRADKIPYVFQYTITGYGKEYEPGIPERETTIEDFNKVAAGLPGPEAIQWRYDPVVVSNNRFTAAWHLENFDYIASRLAGSTRVVNVSFIEPYAKAIRKTPEGHEVAFRQADKHAAIYAKNTDLKPVGQSEAELLAELAKIAAGYGMQLRVCCNQEREGYQKAQCCGAELFAPYGEAVRMPVIGLRPGPSREGCQCLRTIDIGMDNTCVGGCFYCYVTSSFPLAKKNFCAHNPDSPQQR
jgi:hypothetical protein